MPRTWCSRTARIFLAATVTATVAATALGAAPSALASNSVSNLAGGPVVYNPASRYTEFYGVGTDGALYERVWEPPGFPNPGWSGWIDLHGSITDTPSAVYEPTSNELQVYARGANGPLFEKHWHPGSGWSAWQDLGGSITGHPVAIDDPLSGNVEIFATGSDTTLEQWTFHPTGAGTGTWSGPVSLGGGNTDSPSVVYDPATKHLEVYMHGTNGLYQKWWSPSTGWSVWNPLQGSFTGSPAAIWDPTSGNLEVYVTGSDTTLQQKPFDPGTGWLSWVNLSGSIAGTPAPVWSGTAADDPINVFVKGAGGPLFQRGWAPSPGWSPWLDLYGGNLIGSPYALFTPASGQLEAYAVTSAGHMLQAWYNNGWHTADLGGSLADL